MRGRLRTRRSRIQLAVAALLAIGAGLIWWGPSGGAQTPPATTPAPAPAPAPAPSQLAAGQGLFQEACATCHGDRGQGVRGRGPDITDAGAGAADFYLRTGRMPFTGEPGEQPLRSRPSFSNEQIESLVAYVASLGNGPPIPAVDPARGDLAAGMRAFDIHCAGCHQIVGQGGVVVGAFAPDLSEATPQQVAEAVRIGPYVMPKFSEAIIDDQTLNSIARYVEYTQHPDDPGGWPIGNVGPVPEGMVAWLLAAAALLLVARAIGTREPR